MSNPSSDRDRERDRGGDVNFRRGASPPRGGNFNNNYRGANRGGRGGGGRGTGYRPRRYWDNDDVYRRERDYDDRGRDRERRRSRRSRSYSRSPSRSRSRSRSDSRSRSRSRTPNKQSPRRGSEEYQPKSVPGSTSNITSQQQYEPAYTPQKSNVIGQPSTTVEHLYAPQSQQHTNGQSMHYSETSRHDYTQPPPPAPPVQNYKKQHEMPSMGPEPGYYGASVPPNFSAQGEYGSFTQNITYVPTGLISQQQQNPSSSTPTDSKVKREKKKKKRRQRSSSSSSSSSSSESSDSDSRSKGKRKSKKRSGSSDSSSGEDRKEKSKKAGKGVTAEQKKALIAQKENYSAKLELLENNIRLLMQKEYELRDTNADPSLIEENKKLQNEIRARCHAVQTVLDKINDILQPGSNETKPPCPPPPPIISQKVSQPQPQQVQLAVQPQVPPRKRVEYDFYDSGEHWCRLCNVFPETIQDMLDHFHSKEHHAQVEQLGIEEKPWRKQRPYQENAVGPGAKKVPFKGMQFFSPVQGWYCRICNLYMGDHEGAIEHLKCENHTENYLNFLDEHPDWEAKWSSDRQKARGRAGFQTQETQSRSSHGRSGRGDEDLEDAKSIRIQMRNMVKADENRSSAAPFTKTEQQSKVDAVVDEWMGKPQKVKLDIDTQKFAEIVRQKHGQKEKEMLAAKHSESNKPSAPPPPPIIREKEPDRSRSNRDGDQGSRKGGGTDSSRRGNTVEMNLSNARDRERNRYSGSRGGRRRSRSKSNSRSRSRSRGRDNSRERYRRRSSRSKSRSPAPRHRDSKDVSDRDRERVKPKEKEKPPTVTPEVVKETVKKLPIIGKMPLYKKPIISSLTKDKIKSQEEEAAAVAAQKLAEAKRIQKNSEAVESMIQSFVRDSPKNITTLKAPQVVFPTSTTLQDSNFSVPMSSTPLTGFIPSSSSTTTTLQPGMNMHATITMADSNNSVGYGSYDDGFHDGMSMYTHSFDAVTVKVPPVIEEITVPKLIRREPEIPMPSHPMMMNPPSNGSTGGLPDDLQQALDIIYSAPPPPEKIARERFGPPRFGAGPPPGFEFPPSNYGSYHSHHHHQHHHPKPNIPTSIPPPKPVASSFEKIAPYGSNVYEELDDRPPGEDDGPPGEDDGPPGVNNIPPPKIVPPPIIETKKPPPQETPVFKPPPIDEDLEDLRMLGIDVDDAAAAAIR